MGDEDNTEDEADPVGRVVVLALDWAEDGRLSTTEFKDIVDEIQLPAAMYRDAVQAVESLGIAFVEEVESEEPSDSGRDGGWDVDGFDNFFKVHYHRVLEPHEEVELAERIETGRVAERALGEYPNAPADAVRRWESEARDGRRAADEFIEHNLRLVLKIAHKYRIGGYSALGREDLFQYGCIGLHRATEKFDPRLGYKFSTYATWWIRQAIERGIANDSRSVRLPVHVHEQIRQIRRAERELQRIRRDVTPESLADWLDITAAKVLELQLLSQQIDSLDGKVALGDSRTRHDLTSDQTFTDPAKYVERNGDRAILDEALGTLDVRFAQVLRLRFGLGGAEPLTLEEIGSLPGMQVTRERIRQIQKRALKELRGSPRAAELRDLLADFG